MAKDTLTLPEGFTLEAEPPEGFVLEGAGFSDIASPDNWPDMLPPDQKVTFDAFDLDENEQNDMFDTMYFSDSYGADPDEIEAYLPDIKEGLNFTPHKDIDRREPMFTAPPERTIGQKVKEFFIGRPEQKRILPPSASREEKFSHILDAMFSLPLWVTYKAMKGLSLGSTDLAWAAIKKVLPEDMQEELKDQSLDDAILEGLDYDPSGFSHLVGGMADFLGGIKTVSKLIPMAAAKYKSVFDKALETGSKWALARLGKELSKFGAEVINPDADYNYVGAKGVITDFGLGYGFSLVGHVGGRIARWAGETDAGKAISEGAHKLVIEVTKKFPQVADMIRPNPNEYFANKTMEFVTHKTGKTWQQLTPREQAVIQHVARESERLWKIAYRNYLKHPSPDVVIAKEKPSVPKQLMTTENALAKAFTAPKAPIEAAVAAPVAKPPVKGEIVPTKPPTAKIKPEAAKPPVKVEVAKPKVVAEKVKPVPPTKIVSPGQAGPFKITFKATEELPATRIIADPKIARSIQFGENKIAALKTKLKQAKVDKKVAVINAVNTEIAKKQSQIDKLKERQDIKLTNTIARARERVIKLKEATEFKDELRRDAISMIRAIPKELQKDFFNRASKVTTANGLKKLAGEIEKGIDRAEKTEVVKSLKKTIKSIKPKTMLPEFGKPARNLIDSFKVADIKPDTQAKVAQLLEFAQQVESQVSEDTVSWTKAKHLIDIFTSTKAKTVNIQDLPIESLEQINEVLTSLKFQNDFEILQREAGKAETIANEIETVKAEIQTKPSISSSPDATVSLGRAVGEKFITRHQNLESLTDKMSAGVSGEMGVKRNSFTQFVYDTLNEGVDVQYEHALKARDLLRSIMDKHRVTGETIETWLSDKHTFKDKAFTTNEMLSIYMHSRNNHNLTVMLNNGFNKFRTGVERVKKGKVLKLRGFDQTLIDDIVSTLTAEQKAFAREVGARLMDRLNRVAINETSLEAENLEIATVDNYWPAIRDTVRKILGKKVVGLQSLIEGMGILKERLGTGNPLLLRGFFETVYTSNKNVAAYKGLAIPLREVKSVLGDKSLQDNLKKAGYEDELNVMMTQVERIEDNSAETGDIEKAVGVLIGGFAKSRFGINLKIAPRQQLSSTLIFAYVDPKYASEFKGLATEAILEEIFEISPQTQMRVESFRFDRDIGNNQLENDLLRYLTGQMNFTDKFLMGMRFYDTNAIADIYRATKAEVKDFTGLDIKSDEFKTALKQRFEWVLRHTQPTWHPKDRSILGTSPNPLARALTMFMSQREKLVMMVANANQNYAKSKKTSADTKKVARTWGTVGANMALFALYNLGWAVLIKRKAKSLRDFLAQIAADVTGLFFFGRYVGEIIRVANAKAQGKFAEASINTGPEQIVLQTIKAMTYYALAAEHFITGERYKSGPHSRDLKWKTEIWVATESLYDAVAGVTGLPYSGPKDIIQSIRAYTMKKKKKGTSKKIRR